MGIASDVVLIVVAAFIGAIVARKLKQPPVLGYIIAGIVLSAAVISMVLTPFISGLTAPLYSWNRRRKPVSAVKLANIPDTGFTGHTIIGGGGRTGQHAARVLAQSGVQFVIIEQDFQRAEACRASGHPVVFGDVRQPLVLDAADISEAKLLLLTVPDFLITRPVAQIIRHLHPHVHVVALADTQDEMQALHNEGVYMVILPEMEAGLEVATQGLLHYGVPAPEILQYMDNVRQQMYAGANQLNGARLVSPQLGLRSQTLASLAESDDGRAAGNSADVH